MRSAIVAGVSVISLQLSLACGSSRDQQDIATAEEALRIGDLGRAEGAFRNIIERDADSVEALAGLCRTILRREPRDVQAARGFAEASLERGVSTSGLACMSEVLIFEGDFEQGLAYAERAVSANARSASALAVRAMAKEKLARYHDALDDFAAAEQIDSTHPAIYLDRGIINFKLGRVSKALADFDKALTLRPDYPRAIRARAGALGRNGDAATALTMLDAMLAKAPNDMATIVVRANVLAGIGRRDEAVREYGRVLEARAERETMRAAYAGKCAALAAKADDPADFLA